MSAWKSRWSWVRFVNVATSKWIESARPSDRAWEETSITQARSPASSIRRNVALQVDRLRSRAHDRLGGAADDLLDGPEQPAADPGLLEDRADQERRRRLAVRAGHADHLQLGARIAEPAGGDRRHRQPRVGDDELRDPERRARARRRGRRLRLATAGAKSWPSAVWPRTQKNSVPGPTARLSKAMSADLGRPSSPAIRAAPAGSASLRSASLIARDSRNVAGGDGCAAAGGSARSVRSPGTEARRRRSPRRPAPPPSRRSSRRPSGRRR